MSGSPQATFAYIVIGASIVLGGLSFLAGLICLIWYARTRKKVLLVIGIPLTFIVPGIAICAILGSVAPLTFVTYAPAPPVDFVP